MAPKHKVEIPDSYPLATLPDTAMRVLRGAQDVILEKGLDKLTLQEIHDKCGENTSAVKYYFGNKEGLLARVVDAMVHDEVLAVTDDMEVVSESERVSALIRNVRLLTEPLDSMRVFFNVFPYALRDGALHARLESLYRWYHEQQYQWITGGKTLDQESERRAHGLASLLSAVVDGLSIQSEIREDAAIEEALEVFGLMLSRTFEEIVREQPSQNEHPPSEVEAK